MAPTAQRLALSVPEPYPAPVRVVTERSSRSSYCAFMAHLKRASRLLLLTGGLILALIPGTSEARILKSQNVKSVVGSLYCYALNTSFGLPPGIECMSKFLPAGKHNDSFIELLQRSKGQRGERGDYPGYLHATVQSIRDGDTWQRPGIKCTMRSSALKCSNKTGRGFSIARSRWYLF